MVSHHPPIDTALAERLRATCHRLGLSQLLAAARAGLSIQTITRAELYGSVTARTLGALARAYHVTVDDLRGRHEVTP